MELWGFLYKDVLTCILVPRTGWSGPLWMMTRVCGSHYCDTIFSWFSRSSMNLCFAALQYPAGLLVLADYVECRGFIVIVLKLHVRHLCTLKMSDLYDLFCVCSNSFCGAFPNVLPVLTEVCPGTKISCFSTLMLTLVLMNRSKHIQACTYSHSSFLAGCEVTVRNSFSLSGNNTSEITHL